MNRATILASLLITTAGLAQSSSNPATRAGDDARAIQRIAGASHRDFPGSVVQRIAEEDLDLLRGKQSDGSYQYAHYERQEGGRISDRFGIRSSNENALDSIEFSGERVYRLVIGVPSRRLLVARNRRAYIDHVELEASPFGGSRQSQRIDVKSWIAVGEEKNVDLPEIARRAKARVFGRVDEADGGPATIELTFLQAKLTDNSDSPYAAQVVAMSALARAAEHNDLAAVKTYSADLVSRLGSSSGSVVPCEPAMTVTTKRAQPASRDGIESMPQVEVYLELQSIEDLLTGNEGERRDGLDRIHQLIRRLRPPIN